MESLCHGRSETACYVPVGELRQGCRDYLYMRQQSIVSTTPIHLFVLHVYQSINPPPFSHTIHHSSSHSPHQSVIHTSPNLKLINLLLRIPQLAQHPRQLSLIHRTILASADSLVHSRRPTDKNLDILLLGLRQHRLQHLLPNKPLPTLPSLRRLVQHVESPESIRVGVFQLLDLLLQEDVFLGDVAEDEGDFGLVFGVAEDAADELPHGGYAGAAGDEGEVVVLVGF